MQLKRAVIGIDFSESSLRAAKWMARHFAPGTRMVLAHVIDLEEVPAFTRMKYPSPDVLTSVVRDNAEQKLRDLRATLGKARIAVDVRTGPRAETLMQIADDYAADMIVVGAHAKHTDEWNRLGSTPEALVQDARRPVMLVTGYHDAPPRQVLVALDRLGHDGAVLEWVQLLARRFDAEVTAFHAVSQAAPTRALELAFAGRGAGTAADEDEGSDPWRDELVAAGLPAGMVTSEVAFGDPATEILEAARRTTDALVVLQNRGSNAIRRALFGSVVREVIRGADCPVLVVPVGESRN